MKKTIYFIRHGQSTANASLFQQQVGTTVLTQVGTRQAELLAERMSTLPLEAIVASPFARAKATAQILSERTGLPVECSELFIERRRPGVQLRKKKLHPYFLWAQLQLVLFSRFEEYRYSDEETPQDLVLRASEVLRYLSERKEQTIAVVTHGIFMRALYAYLSFGEGISGRTYLHATRGLAMRNTALMVATYESGKWNVIVWNVEASSLQTLDTPSVS